jgi:hypothetical protein
LNRPKEHSAIFEFGYGVCGGRFKKLFVLVEACVYLEKSLILSHFYEILDWNIRVSICRVEGKLLSGRLAGGKNVAVLRGTPFDYGNQLHISSDSCAQDDR